ncbi:hypothetical protein [Corynebacterium cystitidis]|uniref:Uncharacterized protein n=1 Tax=Corynebacterium cystitidis DSM 20524 TaxID=1121357 RepID=A0A1H9W5V0_9CORY|nr:hypothetical protein [Corynebacterium cystitidis]WJY83216.1 hypothetical protein CCYS_11630 [Corynebacterium cystitidis DSM 20524]SES29235.1 hypothetical protein SAMN05661109_02546 [Corynebacterium cystitidis DSM 20524]SNV67683.1 Uncharacterised protein [Corynebacterium cystitidis]
MDQVVPWLTQASLWVQVPVLLAVLMPLAGIGAVVLIRGVDWVAHVFRRVSG